MEAPSDRNPMWDTRSPDVVHHVEIRDALVAEGVVRRMPDKLQMRRDGPEALLEGWLPREPIIEPETRVIAMGSCFAAIFAEWLAENGYNRAFEAMSDRTLVKNPLETPLAVAQQFRWAFGEFDPTFAVWFGKDRQRVEASEERRRELRQTLASAEVMVITIGIAEAWFDRESGEALWRLPPPEHRSARFEFGVLTVAGTVQALETIERLRREHTPQLKIVFSVSPVRFSATFRAMSPIVANVISKAILRAGLDEFFRAHQAELNEQLFYFPAYELVTQLFDDPFEDNRHLHRHYADVVTDLFARHYTTLAGGPPVRVRRSVDDGLRETLVQLEEKVAVLQKHCDDRQRVIDTLKAACDERLALIERLDGELRLAGQSGG